MTLKCKIKELTEMAQGKSYQQEKDEGTWFDLEGAEEELELKELGSIEEVSKQMNQQRRQRREFKARNQKEHGFYDNKRGGKAPNGIVAKARRHFQPYRYDDYPYKGYYDNDYGEGYWEYDARHYNAGYYRSYQKVHYLDRDHDVAPRYHKERQPKADRQG